MTKPAVTFTELSEESTKTLITVLLHRAINCLPARVIEADILLQTITELFEGATFPDVIDGYLNDIRVAIEQDPDVVLLLEDSYEEKHFLALSQTLSCLREFARTHK